MAPELPPCSKHFFPPSTRDLKDITFTSDTSWEEALPKEIEDCFHKHGGVLLKNFIPQNEVTKMRKQMRDVLVPAWNPSDNPAAFGTKDNKEQDKFLRESIDTIRFFMEPTAINDDSVPKADRINKVGHGLHFLDDVFRSYCQSKRIANVVHRLGYQDPVIPQSMYIFKQRPPHASPVMVHQDSAFLHTEPKNTCLGVWAPLDDCGEDNGCLWVRPGSHAEPLRRRMIRNPDADKDGKEHIFVELIDNDGSLLHEGKRLDGNGWDMTLPDKETCEATGYVSVPMQAGDAIFFKGTLCHMSKPSMECAKERDTFQLHLVEGPGKGIKWSENNWMQPVTEFPRFLHSEEMRQRYGTIN